MIFGSMSLMAQEAKTAKSCTGKKTACCASKAKAAGTASASETKVLSMAESLASSDENISKRVCAESGSTSYYKKAVCSTSGKISYNEVEYNEAKNQFVNKSPNDIGNANEGTVIKVVNQEAADKMTKAEVKTMVKADSKMAKKSCSKDASKKCCASKAATKVKSEENN